MDRVKVLIADDHPVVREGLRVILAVDPQVAVVGEAGTGAETVQMASALGPDVVLLDLRMPGMHGVEAIRQIKLQRPECRVVVLTMFDDPGMMKAALDAGAHKYLVKDSPRELVLSTIKEAASAYLADASGGIRGAPGRPGGGRALTPRERQVLQLLLKGKMNKEIGRDLGISELTAKRHMQNIMAKLDARDRTEAAIKALRSGLA